MRDNTHRSVPSEKDNRRCQTRCLFGFGSWCQPSRYFSIDSWTLGRHRYQTVLEGKQHQIGVALQIERPHDVVLVKLDRLFAYVEMTGDLLDGVSLREQLDNIALPAS